MRRLLAGLVTAAALVTATAAQAQQTLILGGSDAVGSVTFSCSRFMDKEASIVLLHVSHT